METPRDHYFRNSVVVFYLSFWTDRFGELKNTHIEFEVRKPNI